MGVWEDRTVELCRRVVSSNSKLKQHPKNVAKQGYKKVSDFDQNGRMEDNQNGRRPQWKTTKMEDGKNGRRPKWKTTKMEDDQNGRRPKWKTTKMEDDQNGKQPKWKTNKMK